MQCSNCNSWNIETEISSGNTVCQDCGLVLSENNIVSEVTFNENSTGGSSIVGQYVAADAPSGLSASSKQMGGRYGKESRTQTLNRARQRISSLASALKMNNKKGRVEAAHRLFTLAFENKFIQGRRTEHVVAACLYTVCRREKTSHLLIDFSEVLQTNVFVLGATFIKFLSTLNLKIPLIEPSLFLPRVRGTAGAGEE